MQSLIEQLKIITDNTKETYVIANNKSAVSLDYIEYVMIIVQHRDFTSHRGLTKCSSSGFQRLLRHISACDQLSFNELQPCIPFPPDQVYRLHHPAIRNYRILLCKNGDIIHTADKQTTLIAKSLCLSDIPPQFYPLKPEYSSTMSCMNVCVCAYEHMVTRRTSYIVLSSYDTFPVTSL